MCKKLGVKLQYYCYENYCTRCYNCNAVIHYDDICNENSSICDYNYKPEPIFYGSDSKYFGVEFEIDNADNLLYIGNHNDEHIYIKSESSLNDGMKIVTHPMSLDYHKSYLPRSSPYICNKSY